jgi:hypothetical protein
MKNTPLEKIFPMEPQNRYAILLLLFFLIGRLHSALGARDFLVPDETRHAAFPGKKHWVRHVGIDFRRIRL